MCIDIGSTCVAAAAAAALAGVTASRGFTARIIDCGVHVTRAVSVTSGCRIGADYRCSPCRKMTESFSLLHFSASVISRRSVSTCISSKRFLDALPHCGSGGGEGRESVAVG